jgi:hypothetical protein
LILEGLNVLQVGTDSSEFVSDYFDFSIYVDADEADIEEWYVERFLTLRESVFQDPAASSGTTPGSPTTKRSRPPAGSGRRSTAATCARTSRRPATGRRSCCARRPTTASPRSSSAAL